MPGAALWQGLVLVDAEAVLARGFQASMSRGEVWLPRWAAAAVVVAVPGRDEEPPPAPPAADLGVALNIARGLNTGPLPGAASVPWSGWLTLAEAEDGAEWTLQHGPLYLVEAAEVRRSGDDALSLVRLTFADRRWRFTAGALRRWSFNRGSAAGRAVADSLRPDGQPYNTADVLGELVGALRGGPRLARVPPRLRDRPAGPREFPAWGSALACLGDEVRALALEEPCLTWAGGDLELWEPGEGASAADAGEVNRAEKRPADLPAALHLWLRGAGRTTHAELGYPADYVLVRGGERIASAAVDNCVPVLHVTGPLAFGGLGADGAGPGLAGTPATAGALAVGYHVLDEALVRNLTGGKHGLDWLHRWLLGPRSFVGADIPRAVADLFDDQAYRLWRLPQVELPDGSPGPYAHLLPLLPRADLVGDRRQAVTVRTYSFAPVAAPYKGGGDERADLAQAARRELARLRTEIRERAKTRGVRDPFGSQVYTLTDPPPLGQEAVRALLGELLDSGFAGEDLAQGVAQARAIARTAAFDGTLAASYEKALRTLYGQDAGDRDLLLQAGELLAQLEAALRAGQSNLPHLGSGLGSSLEAELFGTQAPSVIRNLDAVLRDLPGLNSAVDALGDLFRGEGHPEEVRLIRERVHDLALEARRRRADRAKTQAGGETPARPTLLVIHENLPRRADPGATVYDPDAGVVRTSRLPVWLANPDVAPDDLLTTHLVLRPVRVVFGTVVRPRRDLVPGGRARVATVPGALAEGSEPDVLPQAASDLDTWYVALFRRGDATALPDQVDGFRGLPEDQQRALVGRAIPLEAPWLVEYIPLGATSGANLAALDRAAQDLAAGPTHRRELVREERRTVARPWPVRLDGVVARVTVAARAGFAGFTTTVEVGSSEGALDPGRTRVRPKLAPAARARDARRREGLA